MYAVEVHHLSVVHYKKPILWDINVQIPCGVLWAIVGPNGAGKTTFIKTILNLIQPIAGTVRIFGGMIQDHRHQIAYIPQRLSVDWDFPASVLDVVLMGRYRARGWCKWLKNDDYEHAYHALERVQLRAYAHYHINQLSGGQQQRVFFARALVQNASLYLMDEPFLGIDMATEQIIIEALKKLRDEGKTIVVVHHDLQTVVEYFERVLLLNIRTIATGCVREVLIPKYVNAAYGNHIALSIQHKNIEL